MTVTWDQPIFYAGDDLQDIRVARIQEQLSARGLDALLLIKHDAIRYATGFYTKGYRPFLDIEYAAVIVADGPVILGTMLHGEANRARIRSRADQVIELPKPRQWGPALENVLRENGLEQASIGFDFMPHWIHSHLRDALPGAELVESADFWSAMTAVKLPQEVELLKKALDIAQLGMREAMRALSRNGVTELEVAAAAENAMRLSGSEMTPFISLVASGYNAALFERLATTKKVGDGEMVVIDLGCVVQGYTGDFARTTAVGTPTSEQKRLYQAAHRAHLEALAAAKPGVRCGDIDDLIRAVLRDEGFERYTAGWATGHQLGYGLHGSPVIGPGVDDELLPGMVINIEPALFTPDRLDIGGVEIEDTLLITEGGNERLTHFEYDARLLGD